MSTKNTHESANFTTSPIAIPAKADGVPQYPEYVRLPKPGKLCPWTGLARTKLNELVLPTAANRNRPPVKSVSLRKAGTDKGVRLVHLKSLLDYLGSLSDGGDAKAA